MKHICILIQYIFIYNLHINFLMSETLEKVTCTHLLEDPIPFLTHMYMYTSQHWSVKGHSREGYWGCTFRNTDAMYGASRYTMLQNLDDCFFSLSLPLLLFHALFPIPKHLFNSRSVVYSRGRRSPPWSPWPLLRSRLWMGRRPPLQSSAVLCTLTGRLTHPPHTPLLFATLPPTSPQQFTLSTTVLRIWLLVPAHIVKLLSNSARLTRVEGGRNGWRGSSLLPQPRSEVVLPPLPLFRVKRVCLCVRERRGWERFPPFSCFLINKHPAVQGQGLWQKSGSLTLQKDLTTR